MPPQPPPPLTAPAALQAQLDSAGWAVIDARSLAEQCRLPLDATSAWLLPEDAANMTEEDYDKMLADLREELD